MKSTVVPVWGCGILSSPDVPVNGVNLPGCPNPMGVPTVEELNAVVVAGPAPGSTFALGTFPGELFTEYGLALKAQSPVANTMLVGYTNDHIGYVPGDASWMSGAYGTTPATYACLVTGTGTYLLQTVLALL
jgi:hypothetical protein